MSDFETLDSALHKRYRPALLFTDSGKWKYSVLLDYTDTEWDHWDLWTQAKEALAKSTANGTSGVTMREIPHGWMLVVPEPWGKFSHPIMVRG